MPRFLLPLAVALGACGGAPATSDAGPPVPVFEELGRCASFDELRRPFFGDLHVHTAASLDATLQGTNLTAADAYRFARGEEVSVQPNDAEGNGTRPLRLARPLDFAAVTDHAEYLGTVQSCEDPTSVAYDSVDCRRYRNNPGSAFVLLNLRVALAPEDTSPPALCGLDGVDCEAPARALWEDLQEAAEVAYDRSDACTFTTFVGYEWTGGPSTENLHRNVLFRNHSVPTLPTSYFEEPYAEGLWAALRRDCLDGGAERCDALTIPHNSNLGNERMFEERTRDGTPFDAAYAAEREAMEPLLEIFQHKGASECGVTGATGDELCDFELLPFADLGAPVLGIFGPVADEPNFARHALARGLALEAELGANPFHYGFLASTDTHLATSGLVEEAAFPGHGGAGRSNRESVGLLPDIVEFNPGGLAVLWAEENSREALFAAMQRREAYGTSGPRITLRFFGGWEFGEELCSAGARGLAEAGYAAGVPMGGDLPEAPDGAEAPVFLASALMDPGVEEAPGIPLQVLQVVKVWADPEDGTPRAQVFDVDGDRDNGASVDEATCVPQGAGEDRLCAAWTDPTFDPAVPAAYYVRVLENPTCRWPTLRCQDVDCSDPDALPETERGCCRDTWNRVQQERAWSSPIVYAGP